MATEDDRKVGENLARLRGDMTQQALADAMRESGWKWSQATVWSVEKGERPLRLLEAEDLARILLCAVSDFTADPQHVASDVLVREQLREAAEEVETTFFGVVDAVERHEGQRANLTYWLRVAERQGQAPDEHARKLKARTTEAAVDQALSGLQTMSTAEIDQIIDEAMGAPDGEHQEEA